MVGVETGGSMVGVETAGSRVGVGPGATGGGVETGTGALKGHGGSTTPPGIGAGGPIGIVGGGTGMGGETGIGTGGGTGMGGVGAPTTAHPGLPQLPKRVNPNCLLFPSESVADKTKQV